MKFENEFSQRAKMHSTAIPAEPKEKQKIALPTTQFVNKSVKEPDLLW